MLSQEKNDDNQRQREEPLLTGDGASNLCHRYGGLFYTAKTSLIQTETKLVRYKSFGGMRPDADFSEESQSFKCFSDVGDDYGGLEEAQGLEMVDYVQQIALDGRSDGFLVRKQRQSIIKPRVHTIGCKRCQISVLTRATKYAQRLAKRWRLLEMSDSVDHYIECDICYGECKSHEAYSLKRCGHKFMKSCLNEYWGYLVSCNDYEKIQCPVFECAHKPNRQEIKEILADIFTKFEKVENNMKVARSGGRLKQCPHPDCDGVYDIEKPTIYNQADESKKEPIFNIRKLVNMEEQPQPDTTNKNLVSCPTCEKYFCLGCNLVAHADMSCEEAKRLDGFNWDMVGNMQYGKAHRCPKCKSPFEKIAGCQHITCAVCKYEWCMVCGNAFKSFWHFGQGQGLMCELVGWVQLQENENDCCKWIQTILLWLVMPLLLLGICFMFAIIFAGVASIYCFGTLILARVKAWLYGKNERERCCVLKNLSNVFVVLLMLVIIAIALAVILALVMLFTILLFGIFLIPCMILYPVAVYKSRYQYWAMKEERNMNTQQDPTQDPALNPKTNIDNRDLKNDPKQSLQQSESIQV